MPGRAWLNLLLLAAVVVAAVLLVFRSETAGPGLEIEARDPSPGVDEIRVAVRGAVARPGVVTARPGERVADALARAGGLNSDADINAVNLARRVRDEDDIVVPRIGESAGLLDLNAATAEELEALPAIGPSFARAIVEARAVHGPFRSTDELVQLQLLPDRTYAAIRDLVTVH